MDRSEVRPYIDAILDQNRYALCYVAWTCLKCDERVMCGVANAMPQDTECPGCGTPHMGDFDVITAHPLFDESH